MASVLISGGTGLVGRHLSQRLLEKGYQVSLLSRSGKQDSKMHTYAWDPDRKEIDNEAIDTADYIIHLAGANISDKRWTRKRRKLIIDSRVGTGELIFNKLKERNKKISAFISSSAIGYYGTFTSDKIFTETDSPGNDFLAETCIQWEQMTDRFKEAGIRIVKIRSGVVLTKQGGALENMIRTVKMGIGSALGNGKQYIPWIHIDDLCGIYIKALEDIKMEGVYNAVAPEHITNKEFTRTIAQLLRKPFWFPNIPGFLLKLLFGEMSSIILKGSRVSSDKIRKAGYEFLFTDPESALVDLAVRGKLPLKFN